MDPRSAPRAASGNDPGGLPRKASRIDPRRESRIDPRKDPRIGELQALASRRRLPDGPPSIERDMESLARRLRSEDRRIGRVVATWTDLLPATILARCRIDGLRAGGLLAVTVDGSATHWALDRFLREGGEAKLRAATQGVVQRVKVRVGVLEEDPGPRPRSGEDLPLDDDDR